MVINKMSLPEFNAEVSLHKAKPEYKSYHTYSYQNSKIIKPAQLTLPCVICLIECEFRCNPKLGGGLCFVPCRTECAQECGIIRPLS
jgi:hypothetical protein